MLTRDKAFQIYNQTVEKIEKDQTRGALTKAEAAANLATVNAEFSAILAEIDGVPAQEENMAEFNGFGTMLLEAGEEEGFQDLDEYLGYLSETTGLSTEDLIEVMTDENEPDEEFADAFVDAIMEAEAEMYGEDDDEEEDDEDYEDDEDEVDGEGDPNLEAAYSRVRQLEEEMAEFQAASIVNETLHKYQSMASEMVESGDLPPVAYKLLFTVSGNELEGSDRIAAFSQLAEENGVGIDTEIYALNKILKLFDQMGLGEMGLFNSIVEDEVAEFEMDEARQIDEIAQASHELRKKRKLGLA
jgi:hypothetical protein